MLELISLPTAPTEVPTELLMLDLTAEAELLEPIPALELEVAASGLLLVLLAWALLLLLMV